MTIQRRTILGAALAAPLAATRLAAPALAQAAPIKVGVIGPLSGPYNLFGKNFRAGVEVWTALHGDTVAGRRIEYVYKDLDGPNPSAARAIAQELIVRDRVSFLAGVVFTPNAMAISPVVEQTRTPFVVFNATGSAITARNPFIVRTSFTLPQISTPLGTAAHERGLRRVLTAVSDYSPGHDAEGGFKAAFTAAGGTVVESLRMPLRTSDFGPIMLRAANSGADAVFGFLPAGPPCVAFCKAFFDNGLNTRGLKLLTTVDLVQEPDLPAIGDAGIGVLSAGHYATSHDSPENRAFLDGARRVYGNTDEITFPAVAAYDGTMLIHRMIEATGGATDAPRAMEAVKDLAWISPRGPVSLRPDSRHIRQTIYLREVVKEGGRFANRELSGAPDQQDPAAAITAS